MPLASLAPSASPVDRTYLIIDRAPRCRSDGWASRRRAAGRRYSSAKARNDLDRRPSGNPLRNKWFFDWDGTNFVQDVVAPPLST